MLSGNQSFQEVYTLMRVRKVIKKINSYSQYVSGAALVILMVLTVIDVVIRWVSTTRLPGVFELTPILLTFIVFFSVAYANDHKEHVVIDVLYDALPKMGKRIFSFISTIIYLAIVVLMTWVVFDYGIKLIPRNAVSSTLHIPLWPVIILGGIGMITYCLSVIGDLIFVVKGGILSNEPD